MERQKYFRKSVRIAVPLLFVSLIASAAWAAKPENVFGGKVIITYKQVPTRFKSASAMISYIKNHSINVINEKADKNWEFEILSFFKKPLHDYECQIIFYDTEKKGNRKFMASFTQYVQDRNTRIVGQKVKLKRDEGFKPNWRYTVVVTNRGRELAKKEFTLKGTAVRYGGVVDFTKEEKKK